MDLRGADFAGSDLEREHFYECDMRGVGLRATALYRADFAESNLSGADLSGAQLIKAGLDRVAMVGASLRRVNLVRAEFWKADLRAANLGEADLGGTNMSFVDARGASFVNVQCFETSIYCTVDPATAFDGMSGSMWGLVTVVDGDTERTIDGEELHRFLADRGADVEILKARNPREGTNEYGH